jgi:FixJ family two-component response regulator
MYKSEQEMARVVISISCSDQDRKELERLIRSRTDEIRMIERAKIVMSCLEGKRNDEVAAELTIRPGTVAIWRKRFAANGIKGLRDKQWSGKPPRQPATALRNQ